MIGLLQRVSEASVTVDGECVGKIGPGLMVLVCAERGDTRKEADALLAKLLSYRVFYDGDGKMNLNVAQLDGGLLLVPQFTLAADTRSGTRPSFTPAAPPAMARELFEYTVERARVLHPVVETGQFGADMKVALVNDGPVTFWLQVAPTPAAANAGTDASAGARAVAGAVAGAGAGSTQDAASKASA